MRPVRDRVDDPVPSVPDESPDPGSKVVVEGSPGAVVVDPSVAVVVVLLVSVVVVVVDPEVVVDVVEPAMVVDVEPDGVDVVVWPGVVEVVVVSAWVATVQWIFAGPVSALFAVTVILMFQNLPSWVALAVPFVQAKPTL